MTFEKALESKASKQTPYDHRGVTMQIYVTPALEKDFTKYCQHYLSNKVTDDSAKYFSSNNAYKICGLGPRDSFFLFENLSQ